MRALVMAVTVAVAGVCAAPAAELQALWDQHCVSCHAKDGSGNTRMGKKSGAKDYRDPKVQADLNEEKALKSVKDGINEKGTEKMKPFKGKLTDDQIKQLIGHMRSFGKK